MYGAAPRVRVHCQKFDHDTCVLQYISFRQYSLHLWMRWRTHERKRDHAYQKYVEGNVFRKTYPDLWHLDFLVKRCRRQRVMTESQACSQDCRIRITQPACRMYSLFTIFIPHNIGPTWKWVMSARFGLNQEWVWGAVFAWLQQM